MTTPLTQRKVDRLVQPGKHRDGLVRGLYLVVGDAGAKSWTLRFELHGRERTMGLGSAREFDLRQARERALEGRRLIADGVDPLAQKQADRATAKAAAARRLNFTGAAEAYSAQHEGKWTNAQHRREFLGALRKHVFPTIGNFDVAVITTADVIRTLEGLWKIKPVTADRVRARVENVIDWCVIRGHRPPGTNPAQWTSHLAEVLPAPRRVRPIRHHPALPYSDVPAFMAKLRATEGIAARALTFLTLVAGRTGEIVGARWDEIDIDGALWTVPPGRMKGRRLHEVPLAPEAIALLNELPREPGNPFVFLGANPGAAIGDPVMAKLMTQLRPGFVPHGLRSSFRDWCGEQTNFPRDICEMALSHRVGNQAEQAYRRGTALTKRRTLMAAWARYCMAPPAGANAVVPIRVAR